MDTPTTQPDIYLTGTIGFQATADYLAYQLQQRQGKPVTIAICSLGGCVPDGVQMYHLIRQHGQCHVRFIGMCASAATFLAMGAKTVTAAANSLLLIHNTSTEADIYGQVNKEQLDQLAAQLAYDRRQLATIDDLIANIYAARAAKPLDTIKQTMTAGEWLTPQQALDLGIIDSIDPEATVPPAEQPTNSLLSQLQLPTPKPPMSDRPSPDALQKLWETIKAFFAPTANNGHINNQSTQTMYYNIPDNDPAKQPETIEQPEAVEQPEKADPSEKPEQEEQPSYEELQEQLQAANERIRELEEQLAEAQGKTEEAENRNRRLLASSPRTAPSAPLAVSSATLTDLLNF